MSRLRRLVTIWRATYILQMILLLLLILAVGLEVNLPGVLAMLLRSETGARLLIPLIAAPMLLLDPVAAQVELRMGRLLRAERTALRRVLSVAFMIPGVMLLRRSLLLLLASLWMAVIVAILVLWFTCLLLLAPLVRFVEPVAQVLGLVVDMTDQMLSSIYSRLRASLREIALSPATRIDDDEHIVVPLLATYQHR